MTFTPINKGQFSLETPERIAEFERRRGAGCEEDYAENRRLWSELPSQQAVSDYPLHVDLELASICNLRCPMCYTISPDFRKKVNAKLMQWQLFTRLVDEAAKGGVYSIRLSLRGESFLHPKIVDAVRYAKERGIKEVSTLTNGARIDEAMFREMMEAGLDWITFSIDGVYETFEKIRQPIKFQELVDKLTAFRRIRDEAGSAKPVVKVQGILPAVEEDPETYYDIFAPISDMVSSNPLIDFHEDKATLPKHEDFTCPQIFQRLVIGADGLVMMCANDEVGHHVVGNANRETIHQIWHGDTMQEIRRLHIAHKGAEKLHACSNCYLPLKTYPATISVGGRPVVADKYLGGKQRVSELATPARWQRDDLSA